MAIGSRYVSKREVPLPPALRLFWVAIWTLALVNAGMSDIYYRMNRFQACCTLAYDDPYFVDFWHYRSIFRFIHTAAFFHARDRFAYPAFAAVILDLLYHLGPHAQAIFLSSELAGCGCAAWFFYGKIRRLGLRRFTAGVFVVSVFAFSYPLLYMIQSGNIEIVTCFLTAAGLYAAVAGNNKTAAAFWGAAGAIKIYPLVLLALFFSRGKWRNLVFGILVCAGISVLSMWFVGPTIRMAFAGSINGVGGFVSNYAQTVRTQELPFDHSLLAPVKILLFVKAGRTGTLAYLTKPYMLIVGTLATVVFLARVRYLPFANRVLFLFAAMVALPPVSYDYTLMHLYAPWAMLVLIAIRAGSGHADVDLRIFFACFAVLFTSQLYIYYHWIHIDGALKAASLLVLMVAAATKLLPAPEPEWRK